MTDIIIPNIGICVIYISACWAYYWILRNEFPITYNFYHCRNILQRVILFLMLPILFFILLICVPFLRMYK